MRRTLVSLGFAAVLVAIVLQRVGVRSAWGALTEVSLPLLGAALLLQVAGLLAKALRWGTVLEAARGRPARAVVNASLIGFAGNLVLPARLGEVARAHVAARQNALSRSLVMTTIALTQLVDLLVLGALFLVASFLIATETLVSRGILIGLILAGLAGLVLLYALQRWAAGVAPFVRRVTGVFPPAVRRASTYYTSQFTAGLQLLSQRRAAVVLLLGTLSAWGLELAGTWLGLAAFGVPATLLMSLVLLVVLNLAFCLPLTPANIGPHQFLCVLVLGLFGVADDRALAFSLGMQGACSLLVVILGGAALLRVGLGVGTLYRQVTAPATTAPAPGKEADDAHRTVSRPEGPISPDFGGGPTRAAKRLRELHVCAGADRQGL